MARWYEEGGAAGISLVAERRYFGGQPEKDVPAVLESTPLPLLIKDFILERTGIEFYADLIAGLNPAYISRVTLLLVSHTLGDRLPSLVQYAHKQGFLVLVETRGPGDLPYLSGLEGPPRLVGINNKEIDDLEMGEDALRIDKDMISRYRRVLHNAVIVSESAHRTEADVCCSIAAGADAVLAGSAFMLAADPMSTVKKFAGVTAGGRGKGDDLRRQG